MRQAQIFDVSMVFVVLGAMIAVLLVINAVGTQITDWETIGQRAFEVQNAYAQGDYVVSFMSSAARWASAKTTSVLGEKGGFVSLPCGESRGFAFWNDQKSPKSLCLPDAYAGFYSMLGTEMAGYSRLYAKPMIITIAGKEFGVNSRPFDIQYEFVIAQDRLLGIATAPVFVNIFAPAEKFSDLVPFDFTGLWAAVYTYYFDPLIAGTYIFRPNFEISFNYNLDVYRALGIAAQEVVSDCRSKASVAEKKVCAEEKVAKALDSVNEKPRTIVIDNDNDIYYFTISQDSRKTVYLDGKAPEIRFALALTP